MIGTTSLAIGPAYEDKAGRRGRAGVRPGRRRGARSTRSLTVSPAATGWPRTRPCAGRTCSTRRGNLGARLRPWVGDGRWRLTKAMAEGRSILFEGAQGTMLDLDHGTYPYVTSSARRPGARARGLASVRVRCTRCCGIAKAYTTRVGEGPFPSELHGADGEALRAKGHEFGAVTGRPRRCGWFDAVQVRHAVRVNGPRCRRGSRSWTCSTAWPRCRCASANRVGDEMCEEFPGGSAPAPALHAGARVDAGLGRRLRPGRGTSIACRARPARTSSASSR